jgi:hypothetical protein
MSLFSKPFQDKLHITTAYTKNFVYTYRVAKITEQLQWLANEAYSRVVVPHKYTYLNISYHKQETFASVLLKQLVLRICKHFMNSPTMSLTNKSEKSGGNLQLQPELSADFRNFGYRCGYLLQL